MLAGSHGFRQRARHMVAPTGIHPALEFDLELSGASSVGNLHPGKGLQLGGRPPRSALSAGLAGVWTTGTAPNLQKPGEPYCHRAGKARSHPGQRMIAPLARLHSCYPRWPQPTQYCWQRKVRATPKPSSPNSPRPNSDCALARQKHEDNQAPGCLRGVNGGTRPGSRGGAAGPGANASPHRPAPRRTTPSCGGFLRAHRSSLRPSTTSRSACAASGLLHRPPKKWLAPGRASTCSSSSWQNSSPPRH